MKLEIINSHLTADRRSRLLSDENTDAKVRQFIHFWLLFFSLIFLFSNSVDVSAANVTQVDALRVTELMYHASNPTAAEIAAGGDSSDDAYDFIELQNIGSSPLQLDGAKITVGVTFTFPSQTLAPGGYLVIAKSPASFRARYGTNIQALGPYTGNFSNGGEQIQLAAADNSVIQDFIYSDSWYPATDGSGPSLVVLNPNAAPTTLNLPASWAASGGAQGSPGAPNGATATVAAVTFSVSHGLFQAPFNLTLASQTAGAQIRYTFDGTAPTATTGLVYNGALTVDRTTTFRAVAFKAGFNASRAATATYIFPADVIRQSPGGGSPDPSNPQWPQGNVNGQLIDFGMDPNIVNDSQWSARMEPSLRALPTISIVTDLPNLFDPVSGIYVNAQRDGRTWERPASIELIDPTASGGGFQIDAGLRIRGGYSRSPNNPKHSFRLYFRSDYGTSKLVYPLFGSGVNTFNKLDLRSEQNYSWHFEGDARNAMIREVFARDTQLAMGHPSTRSRWHHLYINGQYWGLYMTEERIDAYFAATTLGGDEDDYDVVQPDNDNGYKIEAEDGTLDAWNRLHTAATAGFSGDAAYYQVQGRDAAGTPNPAYERLLNVDNLIDYMLGIYHGGDRDAPISAFLGNNLPNNFFAVYNHATPDGFIFIRHDAEHSLDVGENNRTGPYPAGNQAQYFNPQWLHQQLVANRLYRARFAAKARVALGPDGALSDNAVRTRLLDWTNRVEPGVVAESARWGDAKREPALTYANWSNTISNIVNNWAPGRAQTVLSQFAAKGWFDGNRAPVANPDAYATPINAALTVPVSTGVLSNDRDDDNDPLTAELIQSPSSGTLAFAADGSFAYVPSQGFSGSVVFRYRAVAGGETSSTVSVIIEVGNQPNGGGLRRIIWDNPDFSGASVTGIDPTVNHNWGASAPDPTINADTFSVRWEGEIIPRFTETYSLITTSDDGIRLWLDNVLVIDNWTDHGAAENVATLPLIAGRRHRLRIEYYENFGDAVARLEWRSASQPREVVPQTRLSSGGSTPFGGQLRSVPGTVQAEDFDEGGQEIAYNDTDSSNNGGSTYRLGGVDVLTTGDAGVGLKVGWIYGSEWLKYTLNVVSPGDYSVSFRVSSGNKSGGALHLEDSAGNNLTGPIVISNTGGWEAFTTVTKTNVVLPAGVQTIKVVFDSGSLDFNYFSFNSSAKTVIANGTYKLSAKHSNKALDVTGVSQTNGTGLIQWEPHGALNQQFIVEAVGNGFYKIIAKHSNKAVEVNNAAGGNGSPVQQRDYDGSDNQLWRIQPTAGGYYKIILKQSGKVLDVANASQNNGADIIQWEQNGDDSQKWRFEAVQ